MKKLLLHLDTDASPSTFDQVVAYDSNVDNIIAYGGITVDNVTSHVHGMLFTRGGSNLKMRVHRAAIKSLYESSNQFLSETTIYDIARKATSK